MHGLVHLPHAPVRLSLEGPSSEVETYGTRGDCLIDLND